MRTGTRAHTQAAVKAAERLRDENDVAPADRFEDPVDVDGEADLFVVAGQIDGDRVVLRLFEMRHDTMPVPRDTAGTRNKNESGHALSAPGLGSSLSHERANLMLGTWSLGEARISACRRRPTRREALCGRLPVRVGLGALRSGEGAEPRGAMTRRDR
jgi:hypothetical protein